MEKPLVQRLTDAAEGRRYGDTSDLLNEAAAELERVGIALSQERALKKLIHDNLSEYIDREGTVDVTISIAFEATREAQSGEPQ